MRDENKNKEQLINELNKLRQRIGELEAADSKHKQARDALRESEEKYRNLTERASDGIAIIQDKIVKYVNQRLVDMWDHDVEEMIGTQFANYIHPEEIEKMVEIYEQRLGGKEVKPTRQTALLRRDGSKICVELNGGVITHEGRPADLVIIRDISERTLVEMALKKSEEKYRHLVENLNDVIFSLDMNGDFTFVSQAVESMVGYKPSEIKGKPFTQFVHLDHLPVLKKHFQDVISGSGRNSEYRVFKSDGETLCVRSSSMPIYEGDRIVGMQGILTDITERKQMEEALRESEKRYRLLFDNANDAIFIVQDGAIKFSNPKTREMGGYTADELAGISFVDFIHPDDREMVLERHKRRLRGDEFESVYSFKILNKAGEELWVNMNSVVTMWEGKPATLNFLRDITAHKRLEAQFQQAQKMEAIGTLAGGISHDFNNLLQAILGYTQILLLDKQSKDPDFARLREIEKSAQRASELTQQLLTFSRKVKSKLRPVNLSQEARQVEKLLRRTIPKMIDIQLHLDEKLQIINADPAQMEQVLMNLAVNARDAMLDGGKLVIGTENVDLDEDYCKVHLDAVPGKCVLLSVSDTGHGMDKETLEHIFEPFYTTKETGKGTGLGLSMVYGIVKNHGGYIMCYSEPGEGTTFKIYFPVIEAWGMEQGTESKEEYMPEGGSETILLVDDEELLRELGEEMLTRFGYTVLKAPDGESALELYREKKGVISLTILDLIMPGMGGKKCLEELLRMDPEAKVVIASGYSINGHTRNAIEAGAKGFIGKPYNVNQVLRMVRDVLDRKN